MIFADLRAVIIAQQLPHQERGVHPAADKVSPLRNPRNLSEP